MLGRKSYTREELDRAKATIEQQLAAYQTYVAAVADATTDQKVDAAREAFEARFFNNLVLILDRYFVHRLRMVTGKDGNPLNEVELLSDSLMNHDGVLRGNNAVRYVPEESVVKLQLGDTIRLTADDFARLAAAFFAELERRFL